MGIIVVRPTWVTCEFFAELPCTRAHFVVINNVLESSI